MKEKIRKIFNRDDWTFLEFLKEYWWIESLAIIKMIIFIDRGYYGYTFGILFLLGASVVLWVLYRIGLQ